MLSILSLIKSADDLRFMEQLLEKYERLMYHMTRCCAHDKNLCEDIVQDSLENLIKNISALRELDGCRLPGYVVTTVRNTAYGEYRKAERRSRFRAPMPDRDGGPVDPMTLEDMHHVLFRRHIVSAAWKKLPDRDQILLYGKYFMGLTDKELAGILGYKAGSIRMMLTRARRNMAELIQKNGG